MAGKADGGKSRKRAGRPGGKTVKRTIQLSGETDMKLDVWARMAGTTRSKAAEEILAEALRCVVISVRTGPAEAEPKAA